MPTLQRRLGLIFTLAGWALLLLLLAWLAGGFFEHEAHPNREVTASRGKGGSLQVILQRNRAGHYVADGSINGHSVSFLVDTGATLVAIDVDVGEAMGLERGSPWSVQTANGVVRGWRTLIASIDVAGIRQQTVPAVMLPNLGGQVLLGMSFLKRVEMIQKDDALTLREDGH